MKRTFVVYLIPLLLLLNTSSANAFISSLSNMFTKTVKTITNMLVGKNELSSDKPEEIIKQIQVMLKNRGLNECEIDLDKLRKIDVQEFHDQVIKELQAKLPGRRSIVEENKD